MSETAIPEPEVLRSLYEPAEVESIETARKHLDLVDGDHKRLLLGREFLTSLWPDWLERFQKTTVIVPKEGPPCLLILNYAQKRFMDEAIVAAMKRKEPARACILKARQLGFSTLIQGLHYFWCNEHRYRNSLTISYDDDSTEELFQKAKFCDETQWFQRDKARARANTLQFAKPHHSTFFTRTAGNFSAGRGLTVQHLHCSEVPMWPDPDATMTSAQQCVPSRPNTSIIWESTARGAVGLFYDTWNMAESGTFPITPFFAPWYWDRKYRMDFPSSDHRNQFMRTMSVSDREYMQRFELSPEQMRWRRFVIDTQLSGNERAFRQEYPASAQEAFLTSGAPVFDPDKVLAMHDAIRPPLWMGDILMSYDRE